MYILQLSYIAPLEDIDRLRDEHMAWVAAYDVMEFAATTVAEGLESLRGAS